MDFKEFQDCLERAKSLDLPGEEAQIELAPSTRLRLSEIKLDHAKVRKAGVLALFEKRNNQAQLILTSRTEYPGTHGGQISFPGGGREKEDVDFIATAQRETLEEIGVDKSAYQMWGALSSLYIPPSNFLVYPFLAFADEALSFVPEEKEVAQIHSIPFDRFLDPAAIKVKPLKMRSGFSLKTPLFEIDGLIIWGATAMMIAEIRRLLIQSRTSL